MNLPLFLPDEGLTLSQLALSRTLQDSVPRPILETRMVFLAGLDPSTDPVKERLVGLTLSVGLKTGALNETSDWTASVKRRSKANRNDQLRKRQRELVELLVMPIMWCSVGW